MEFDVESMDGQSGSVPTVALQTLVTPSRKGDGPVVHFGKWVNNPRATLTNPVGLFSSKLKRTKEAGGGRVSFQPHNYRCHGKATRVLKTTLHCTDCDMIL